MEERNWKKLKEMSQKLGCYECPLGNEILNNEDNTDFIKTCNKETLLDESKQIHCETDETLHGKQVAIVATAARYVEVIENMKPSKEAIRSAAYLIMKLANTVGEQNNITNKEVRDYHDKMKDIASKIFENKKEPTILQ